MLRTKYSIGREPFSTVNEKVSERIVLSLMSGCVGLLGGAVCVCVSVCECVCVCVCV